LGSFQNIKIARDALVSLILGYYNFILFQFYKIFFFNFFFFQKNCLIGSPPGKVYAQLRAVASRMSERF